MRPRSLRNLIPLLLILTCAPALAPAGTAGKQTIRIVSSDADGVEFLCLPPPGDSPVASFLIGLPPDARADVELTELRREAHAAPAHLPATLPAQPEVLPPFTYRMQRVCVLRIPLITATRGFTERLVSARVRVRFRGAAPERSTAIADPLFEGVLRTLLVNYDAARSWRIPPPAAGIAPAPQMAEDALLIGTSRDGWYRLTQREIRSAGVQDPPGGLDGYRLFRGEVEIPLLSGPDSSLSFWGVRHRRNADDTESMTDTTMYRLLASSGRGLRYAVDSLPAAGAADTIRSTLEHAETESNTGYFAGATEEEVINNDPVTGEGWFWERVFPGQRVDVSAAVPSPDTGEVGDAQLTVRLVSMTPDSPGVDHRVRLLLNDTPVGVHEFDGRTVAAPVIPLAHNLLRPGANTLSLVSEETARPVNLVALDRLTISYRRILNAEGDLLVVPHTSAAERRTFRAGGFTDSTILVLDPAGGRMIAPHGITPEPGGTFSIVWSDSGAGERTYALVSAAGTAPPALRGLKRLGDPALQPGGADLIIITHPSLQRSANRLAAHRRAAGGLRVAVVDVEEIYHAYTRGIPDPAAIREFLRIAYGTWTPPAPGAVLLLGDASWDPRGFLPTTRRKDLVPAYGFPAGDAWYGILDSTGLPLLQIGRLPAADSVEADLLVTKLLRYDALRPGEWMKRVLFVTGGITPAEQTTYRTRSEALIRDRILPDPFAGDPRRAYKSSDAPFDTGLRDSVRQLLNDGVLFLNYLGHSSAQRWGVDIGPPATLDNTGGRMPFVASVSCNIGAFAEPSGNVLGEELLLPDDRGAIAVWSSSSLGYPTPGTQLVRSLLTSVCTDSLRGFGELTTAALLDLWMTDPSDPVVRAMVRLNPLLGDPTTRLALPLRPDPAVAGGDLALSLPTGATGGRDIRLRALLRNNGVSLGDTVDVRVTLTAGVGRPASARNFRRLIRQADTLDVAWRTEEAGPSFQAEVVLDPAGRLLEADESNNTARSAVEDTTPVLLPVRPLRDQQVPSGPVEFLVILPQGTIAAQAVLFEADTSAAFTSPAFLASGPVALSNGVARWVSPLPAGGMLYFWRARIAGGDGPSASAAGGFTLRPDAPAPPAARIAQEHPVQFARSMLTGVMATDSGLMITAPPVLPLEARSLGDRADPAAGLYTTLHYGDRTYEAQWWVAGRSFVVLRVARDGRDVEFRGFDCIGDPAASDSMARFLARTAAGDYLALASVLDPRTDVTEALRSGIESLGSTRIREAAPGDAWAFAVRKGEPASAAEALSPDTARAVVQVVPSGPAEGEIRAPAFAAPVEWDSLRWEARGSDPGNEVTILLRRVRPDGVADTLARYRGLRGAVSLEALNTPSVLQDGGRIEPIIHLRADDAVSSPVFRSWSIDLTPPPELDLRVVPGTGPRVAGVAPVTATVRNLGLAAAGHARIVASAVTEAGERPVGAWTIGPLAAGDTASLAADLAVPDLPGGRAIVRVEPLGPRSDLVGGNNAVEVRLPPADSIRQVFRILADGSALAEGDAVAAEPLITAELPDWYGGQEIVSVTCRVDGWAVAPEEGGTAFRPVLSGGEHRLEIRLVKRNSAAGRDTLVREIRVRVDGSLRVTDLYTFPNPFADRTLFSFTVGGARAPEEAVLRLYTVRGRKILEIAVGGGDLRVGVNSVAWDGRDADGDDVANGTYLVRLTVRGADGSSASLQQKLVRVR